jgi:hypothetical protein
MAVMPLIQIFTSATPDPAPRGALLSELSSALAHHFGKPEAYVMTCLVPGLPMTFGGTSGPTCFAAVKNIGRLTPDKSKELSHDLCARLAKGLGIAQDRIYIEFTDAIGYLWGHDGDTFG